MSRSLTNVRWALLLTSALSLCVGCDGDNGDCYTQPFGFETARGASADSP